MANKRKIPMRKCVASGEMRPKKELIRIVRSKEGEVSVDPTGKKSGRGAYLTLDRNIILAAKNKNVLASHLQAEVTEDVYNELLTMADGGKDA